MDYPKRTNQIKDEEVLRYKSEIKRRLDERMKATQILPTGPVFWKRVPILFGAMVILVLTVFLFLYEPKDPTYDVVKMSNNSYAVMAKEEDFDFQYYFDMRVGLMGDDIPHGDRFTLFAPYLYTDAFVDYPPTFEVYKVDQFTYYVKSQILDQFIIFEASFFKRDPFRSSDVSYLEIDDLEKDIQTLYEWLRDYVPVESEVPGQGYLPNPETDSLPDSKAKRNYLMYVDEFYSIENTYGEEEYLASPTRLTIVDRFVAVADDVGEVAWIDPNRTLLFSVDGVDLLSSLPTSFHDYMRYQVVGPFENYTIKELDFSRDGAEGKIGLISIDLSTYGYVIINEDLNAATSVRYTITLPDEEEATVVQPVWFYNEATLAAPFRFDILDDTVDRDFGERMKSLRVEVLNASGEVLRSFVWTFA